MKNIHLRNRIIPVVIVFCGLLVLFGCSNPLSPSRTPESEPGTGTLMLTINGAARTIVPIWREQGDFVFSLEFTDASGDVSFEIDWDGQSPIVMAVGDWNLSVRAYLPGIYVDGGEPRLAAQGAYADTITIQGGTPAGANILLRPIPVAEGPGMGTFAWEIDFSEIQDASSIGIEIEMFDGGAVAGPPALDLPSLYAADGIWAYSHSLPAGWYIVTFVLYRGTGADQERATRSAVLRVYQYLYSEFSYETHGQDTAFTPLDFPASLLNVILRSWDTGSRTWNFPDALTYEHFLAADIDGVTEYNFFNDTGCTGCISYWLNRLTTEPPANWGDLQDLVNEALDGIAARGGTLTVSFPAGDTLPENLTHIVTLTRPDGLQFPAYPVTDTGPQGFEVTVPTGTWYITVHSEGDRPLLLNEDVFPDRMTLAFGFSSSSVAMSAGGSASVSVTMNSVIGLDNHEQLQDVIGTGADLGSTTTIMLMGDITAADEYIIIGASLTLIADIDVTIYRGDDHDLSMFFILEDSALTLGSPGSRGTIRIDGRELPSTVPLIDISGSAVVMHEGVTLTGNDNAGNGGGVRISSGTFTMHGGTITGNTANYGGGVLVDVDGVFTMYGGAIHGNTAGTGASLYVAGSGTARYGGAFAATYGTGLIPTTNLPLPAAVSGLAISFADLADEAPDIVLDPLTVGFLDLPATISITVTGANFTSVRWFLGGSELTGPEVSSDGETLALNSARLGIGRNHLTVAVIAYIEINGTMVLTPASRIIPIDVTL